MTTTLMQRTPHMMGLLPMLLEKIWLSFVSDGSSVMSSVVANTTNYSYVTIHIYEGYPTDSATLVASEQLVGYDLASDIMIEALARFNILCYC